MGTIENWILKENAKYWWDITNATTSNNFISWVVNWHEYTVSD